MFLLKSNNSFEGQRSDENVVLLLRMHWILVMLLGLLFFILALAPFVLYFLWGERIALYGIESLFWFFVSLYFIIWWQVLFYRLMMYFLNVWIITDHRIIDSEQLGLFNRKVTEARISRVQDISTHMAGPLATFLNFGNVEIETAGERENISFRQVPNPLQVRTLLMQANNEYIKHHPDGLEPDQKAP